MPTSCFDSKQKFISALRQAFQGGTFSLFSSCTNRDVMEYYQYLKRDFEAGDQQHCNLMAHVGLQREGYWCLSEEVCLNLQSYVAIFNHGMLKTFNIVGSILYYYRINFLVYKCNEMQFKGVNKNKLLCSLVVSSVDTYIIMYQNSVHLWFVAKLCTRGVYFRNVNSFSVAAHWPGRTPPMTVFPVSLSIHCFDSVTVICSSYQMEEGVNGWVIQD